MTKEIDEAKVPAAGGKARFKALEKIGKAYQKPNGSYEGKVHGRDGKPVKVSVPVKEETIDEMTGNVGPIERESNKRLGRTDGTQAGPDPKVQKEIRHAAFLNRVVKGRKHVRTESVALDEDRATHDNMKSARERMEHHNQRIAHHEGEQERAGDNYSKIAHHQIAASHHSHAYDAFSSAYNHYALKNKESGDRAFARGEHHAKAAKKHVMNEELNEVSKDKLVRYMTKSAGNSAREKGLELAKNKYWNSPRVKVGSREKNHTHE